MKRFKTPSFFKSLVLISCILGILPLLLLGYLSYTKSAAIVQEEVTTGNQLILQQNKEQVESHLRTIDTLTTQTIGGPVTTNAVSMSTALDLPYQYEYLTTFKSLIYKLVQIQVFELGINDVHLISFRKNWLVESGSVYPMEARKSNNVQDEYLRQLKQQLTAYRDDQKRSYWKLIKDEKLGFVLKLIKHIPLNSSDPYGLITVNVPMNEISKRLTGEGQLGTVMIVDSDGVILSHMNSAEIGTNVRNSTYYMELMKQAELAGFFSYEIKGKKYAVIYNRSLYNQWTYISLTPLESLTEKSKIIRGYTIIAIGILIVLVVITSIIVSLRMYSPIRRIYRFIKPDAIMLKGNELQYIGDQVQQMVQSQTRMVDEIESLNRQARVFYVIKLLLGDIKADELEDNLEKYGYPVDWDQWCLIALQIDTLEDTQYSEKDTDLLLFAIHNMVEEIIPTGMRLSPIIQNQCLLLFVGSPVDVAIPLKVLVFNNAESIQRNVKHYLKLKVSVGISRGYSHFIHAPAAHQESLDALAYRIRLGQESILFIDEVQPEKQVHFRYPKDMEFRILEAVRQLDIVQAKEGLEQMVSRYFENTVNHYDYQIFLGRLFNNLTGMVQDAGASVQDIFQKDVFTSDILLRMQSPDKIQAWFEQEVLMPLIKWMEDRQRKQEVNISKEIIEAIHESYDKDLNIELFAARLNYHPSYISRVFKKDTGINFTEYLSQYRIELSKKWLKETDMKISDIAETLRYSTASNFNRNFKKIVQVTPSQYREQFK
ncbi:putative HTH-type transcriptional regulator YtdP [Paenibacillus baekrokdamisoli]|uniref:Putative HTH-type transcriptional regulator YtdP n=1 Tax=Paenibacillus baekrokdamisoli TaxID=1712516 RepID=A0A3G9IMH2_9BACL|nr:helix-turn-helix domain-containing protein [Paenibacillus baekrokdamisoli]MBB3067391.1 AraC-like DNA-binding protein/type II secretory pathway pseudopilin PulG [Paenibacillus baekrokdamisoli]BBH19422.1 putative HTH-type transcriptional regulator YtdP [Paenibacillus baekrokdamisoli]